MAVRVISRRHFFYTHCKTFQRRWYPIWLSLGIFNIEAYWIHCCAFTHKHTCNMSSRNCSISGNPLLSQREPKQSTRPICARNWSSYGIIKLLDSSEFSVLTEMLFHNSCCSQAYCHLLNLCGLWHDPVNYSFFTLTPGDFMPCCGLHDSFTVPQPRAGIYVSLWRRVKTLQAQRFDNFSSKYASHHNQLVLKEVCSIFFFFMLAIL